MRSANRYLKQVYGGSQNREFGVASTLAGKAFQPFISENLPSIT